MKEYPNIDELLSSYVDGELSARQHTEIRQLAEKNEQVKARMQSLQNLKSLIGALPRPEAPAEISDQVRSLLERRTLFGETSSPAQRPIYHLVFQRIRSAAAVAALIAVFFALIYSILSPPRSGSSSDPGERVAGSQSLPGVQSGQLVGLTGRLEMDCAALSAVDSALHRTIQRNGIVDYTRQSFPDRRIYQVKCNELAFQNLVLDMQDLWPRFTDARLYLHTNGFGQCVEVESISSSQLLTIATQKSAGESLEIAKRMRVRKGMQEMTLAQQVLASLVDAPDEVPTVAKPMMTGQPEPGPKADSAGPQTWASLTFVLARAKQPL